jgi:hypothetical protein
MLQKYSLVRLLEAFRSAFPLCFVTHSCDITPYFVSLAKGGINSVSPRWSPIPDHVSSKSDTKTTAVFNKTVRSSGMRTASDVYDASSVMHCLRNKVESVAETQSGYISLPRPSRFPTRSKFGDKLFHARPPPPSARVALSSRSPHHHHTTPTSADISIPFDVDITTYNQREKLFSVCFKVSLNVTLVACLTMALICVPVAFSRTPYLDRTDLSEDADFRQDVSRFEVVCTELEF